MLCVALAYATQANFLQQWEYALSHFVPDAIYVHGANSRTLAQNKVLGSAIYFEEANELPADHSLILLAPQNGLNLQGDESLSDFSHPADAIYYFGSDSAHIPAEKFDTRQPDNKVYIPVDTNDQMYSFTAWCVVAWDRRQKG